MYVSCFCLSLALKQPCSLYPFWPTCRSVPQTTSFWPESPFSVVYFKYEMSCTLLNKSAAAGQRWKFESWHLPMGEVWKACLLFVLTFVLHGWLSMERLWICFKDLKPYNEHYMNLQLFETVNEMTLLV